MTNRDYFYLHEEVSVTTNPDRQALLMVYDSMLSVLHGLTMRAARRDTVCPCTACLILSVLDIEKLSFCIFAYLRGLTGDRLITADCSTIKDAKLQRVWRDWRAHTASENRARLASTPRAPIPRQGKTCYAIFDDFHDETHDPHYNPDTAAEPITFYDPHKGSDAPLTADANALLTAYDGVREIRRRCNLIPVEFEDCDECGMSRHEALSNIAFGIFCYLRGFTLDVLKDCLQGHTSEALRTYRQNWNKDQLLRDLLIDSFASAGYFLNESASTLEFVLEGDC